MANEIAIIKDRNVLRIEVPPGTKLHHGDRALNVDFDIVSLDGEMFLANVRLACGLHRPAACEP
jgi:hypothetical protein